MIGNNVLIVVDQTPDAETVLREGLELCAKLDVTPTILTSMTKTPPTGSSGKDSQRNANQKNANQIETEQVANRIRKTAERFMGKAGKIEVLTPTGDAALEIRRAAATLNTDLIIIGNHPKAGLGLFLGSTANVVLHDTPCHVLAVTLRVAKP